MPHARLTHPTRPTIEFRGGQESESQREAVANITNELATDRTSLVHTETREVTETERGTATGLRRARNSDSTDDPRQALAEYAVELEAHVDEFQGEGYTYENDQSGAAKSAVLERVEWSIHPGQTYELDYEATVQIGRGVFESRSIDSESVSVGAGFDAMLRVDGTPLPGMRDYRVATSIGINPNAVFDRDSAENNDLVVEDGRQRTVSYTGIHTGTRTERANADSALESLVGTKENVTLETYFPGYEIEGYVTQYNSTFNQNTAFGENVDGAHRYSLQFVEGQRA